jgi:hypothetical protein
MKKRKLTWLMLFLSPIAIGWSMAGSSPQAVPEGTVPVSMVVSVEAKHGGEVPIVSREDVRVLQGGSRLRVTDWVPLQGDRASLELYMLIDDATDSSIGMQFDDLRQFMNAQPPATSIALGYIRFGTVDVVQTFTKDHSQAAKALRIPMDVGAGIGSPYVSVENLIKNWPKSTARREILMVTNGIDRQQGSPNDPYLRPAIEQAQRAGIQVYAIYASSEGHFGHTFGRIIWGQNNLAQLAEATGGESYFQSFQTPIAFAPFLDQIANQLKHQYQLTFLAKAGTRASYQSVRLETEVPNTELVAADRVFVPATK